MEVQILHSPDCPNHALARTRLDEAIGRTGARVTVVEREVGTPADAEALGMRGSPTVLVDGEDVVPVGGPASLSCRLYFRDGVRDFAPSLEELAAALTR